MSRPQITLSVAVFSCGLLIISAFAADPKKPSKSNPAPVENAEPTPVDEPATVPEPEAIVEEDRGPWEVTDRVELVFKEQIAAAGDKTLSARVLLKNKSDTDIPGKLVLVVDGSSIEGATLHEPQGQFTETTPYLQMLPVKRILDAGKETPVKSLILTSAESTADMDLASASLRWRAFTLTKPGDLDIEPPADEKKVPGKDYTWGTMRKVMDIQSRATVGLVEKHDGAILGTGTSEDANGNLVIRVYAAQGGMSRKLPGSIEGIPVELTVTGTIKAGPAYSRVTVNDGISGLPPAPEPETTTEPGIPTAQLNSSSARNASLLASQIGPPTRRFNRPVPIGVSGINQTDVCASGTLGCRCVASDGKVYILSNNHVLAKLNAGVVGQAIGQPSKGDKACVISALDVVGTLSDFQVYQFYTDRKLFSTAPINTMDAAVALCTSLNVDTATPTEGYGTPSRQPQENLFVGMAVQKYGRTTSLTKGKVYALNVEANITVTANKFARFRYCIDVQSLTRTPAFSAGGDSGSLVVTQADRRPIGILFAGGGYDTFVNPISPVLTRFKVGIDDGTGAAPVLGSGRTGTAIGPVKR